MRIGIGLGIGFQRHRGGASIPNITPPLDPGLWAASEATPDAQTRQAHITADIPPQAGKVLLAYRGSNPLGNLSTLAVMPHNGIRYDWTATGKSALGSTVYNLIAWGDAPFGDNPVWITDAKTFIASNTPDAPSASYTSPGSGAVTITVSPPNGRGRTVTLREYRINGGAWTAYTGNSIALTGLTNGQEYALSLRDTNVNNPGGIYDLTVIPQSASVPPGLTAEVVIVDHVATLTITGMTGTPAPTGSLPVLTLDGEDVLADVTGTSPEWQYVIPDNGAVRSLDGTFQASNGVGSPATVSFSAEVDPLEPYITEPAVITGQPIVGETVPVDPGAVVGADTTSIQWWRGDPDAGGTLISGATSVARAPVAADFGHILHLVFEYTAGARTVIQKVSAPSITGARWAEDWSTYAAGNTFTQLDAQYDRNNAGMAALVITDANAPAGLAVESRETSAGAYGFWRSDIYTFTGTNAAEIDTYEELFLFRATGTATGQHFLRPAYATNSIGINSPGGISVRHNVTRHQLPGEDPSGSAAGAGLIVLTVDAYYWVRHRVDIATNRDRVKIWPVDQAEPMTPAGGWSGDRTHGSAPAPRAPGIGARNMTGKLTTLYYSCGLNTDAPYWSGFVSPPASTSETYEYAAAAPADEINFGGGVALGGITIELDGDHQIGNYAGSTAHFIYNPVGGDGVRILADNPLSSVETLPMAVNDTPQETTVDVWINGLMTDYGKHASDVLTPGSQQIRQAFTEGTLHTSLPIPYEHARNRSVGVTGVPIEFAPGETGCVIKAVNKEYVDVRTSLLTRKGLFYVVNEVPPTGAIAPGVCSPNFISRLTSSDVDKTTNITATASGKPNLLGVLSKIAEPWENQNPQRPHADRITGADYEDFFRRDGAATMATAMLVASMSGDNTARSLIRDALVTIAEDTVQSLEKGIVFNHPKTAGSPQNGRKGVVVFSALLTGDSKHEQWAQDTTWAAEDTYCQYITEECWTLFGSHVSGVNNGFLETDIGDPWWFYGRASWGTSRPAILNNANGDSLRSIFFQGYQEMFHRFMLATHALAGVWPAYKEMWNNQPVWDWCDRLHYRTLYDGSGTVGLGRLGGGTNNPLPFHQAAFAALAPPPVWDW